MADKTEHPHAYVLRWNAAGERVEWLSPDGYWQEQDAEQNLNEVVNADFAPSTYRIKPRTITIGKYEVAEPIRTVPLGNTPYFFVSPGATDNVAKNTWLGFPIEMRQLHSGMCWLKREDAELAAKAITELLTGKAT